VSLPEPILAGLRLLVVEDNYLVASVIVQHLRLRGAHVLGPAPSVELALQIVNAEEIDAALLDIDLQGSTVAPVARRLRERSRPFVFLTGYGSDGALPDDMADERRLTKPVHMDDLAAAVLALLGRAPGAPRPG